MSVKAPGVYWQHVEPSTQMDLRTGVPAFLGYAGPTAFIQPNAYAKLTHWQQFEQSFGREVANGFLAHAVRAFFENGGRVCYVGRLPDVSHVLAPRTFLESAEMVEEIDLICVPDIHMSDKKADSPEVIRQMQIDVLEYCERRGDCFAILDAAPSPDVEEVCAQRRSLGAWSNGALYFPWVKTPPDRKTASAVVPPCGHVAGIYARSDESYGVHKAPANEALQYVVDLRCDVSLEDQEVLNPIGINCLRILPGRGIRVWGARTLSGQSAWTYVNVRRLFITASRWMEHHFSDLAFEPNNVDLWGRIERRLLVYFDGLFRQGALKGRTAEESFYVKCNAETNTCLDRDAGRVVAEIGLAPLVPNEFVFVRLIQTSRGMTLTGPDQVQLN